MLAGGYLVLFVYLFLQKYLLGDATFRIGICLAPYVLLSSQPQKSTWRFGVVVVLLLAICFFAQATSLRYLLVLASVVFMIESLYGKLDSLLIWLLLIISPLFRYISEVFTFPLRLQLSEWAGAILRITGFSAETSGNIIQMNGTDFAVDPACMGLQMLGVSFLIGIFLMTHYKRLTGKRLPPAATTALILLIFILNVLSNLMRIVALVVFSIAPENPMHDIAGMFSLLIYVLLPAAFLIKFLYRYYGKPTTPYYTTYQPAPFTMMTNVIILAFCCFLILQSRHINIQPNTGTAFFPGKKYSMTRLNNGITRYRSENALIYIKGIPHFYSTDHSPYLCWKGSGYRFTSVREEIIYGMTVYVGTLHKGQTELQTAWWFTNTSHITISQLDWRWRALKGEPDFQLINVTVDSKSDLKTTVQEWLLRNVKS